MEKHMSTPNDFLQHVKTNNLKAVENVLGTISHTICCRALEVAAENGLKAMTHCLLLHIGQENQYSSTPIFEALIKASINGHLDVVKLLLPNCRIQYVDRKLDGKPLYEAAGHGQLHVVQFLFPHCSPTAQLWAMTEACRESQYDVAAYLIDKVDHTHDECEGFEYAAQMAIPEIFALFEPLISSLPLEKRITGLQKVCSNRTPRAAPVIEKLLKQIPESTKVSEALLLACMSGQQNNAEILYERSDTNWVLEQLYSHRIGDYNNWKFFDQWAQAQKQKTALEDQIQTSSHLLSRKKL